MSKKVMKIPKSAMYFTEEDADVQLTQNEDGKESFSMLAYSGKIIKGFSFWGDLAIDVSGIQFNGKRYPILEQHELAKKIGVSNKKPSTESNQVYFDKVNLLSNPVAQEFKTNLDDEFPYQASLGIRPLVIEELADDQSAEVNGYKMKGPGTIIRKSLFKEASVCVFGADPNTKIASLADEAEEISVELIEKEQQKTEEKSMTLKELQEKYPEIFAQIQKESADKDAKIQELSDKVAEVEKTKQELESKNTQLSEDNAKNVERLEKLERADALRKEKDIKQQADNIVIAKLSEHNIPVRLHEKIRKQINHQTHVTEENALDEAKFTEAVEAEVKDWAETLGEFTSTSNQTVQGFGGGDRENFSEADADEDSDRLVNHLKSDNK